MKHRYHEKMDQRMFDFQEFYAAKAWDLPIDCKVAEVGIADGSSSIFMLEHLLNLRKRPKFWMIDSLAYGGNEQLNQVLLHIGNAKLSRHVNLLSFASLEASCRFPDRHFDFVFIDASHTYEGTKADIRLWWHKVKFDGILAGHDYLTSEGVKQAVDEVVPASELGTGVTSKGYGIWFLTPNPKVPLL